MHIRLTLGTALAALLILVPTASAQRFAKPVQLSNPPAGGEPSIASDPFGHVMVVAPQGIPSVLNNGGPGTGVWVSGNDARTFAKGKFIGSFLGGGDDDVIYDKGTWYEADLEAAATEVCTSSDAGKTWNAAGSIPDSSGCTTINAGQAGPSDDRPWLTADPSDPHRVYLTYHEFLTAQPLAFRTDNGGADDFASSCGSLVTDPGIEANVPSDITGGTLVARPVVDRSGTVYVLFATTTQEENAAALTSGGAGGTFSQLYLAVSKDHCQTFTDYTVFDGQSKYGPNTVQFGDIFNDLAIDGAGNLYVVGAGYVNAPSNTASVYLLSSTDHGQHWSAPLRLDRPGSAYMLPAAVGGPKAGQLAIGYFRTINAVTDANSSQGKWTYSTAQSGNATASHPTFSYRDANPGFVYHNGEICNLGILCGAAPDQPSDRSLLDFTSAAVDGRGCVLYTFAGNPTGSAGNNDPPTPTNNYVARQVGGCFQSATRSHHKHRHHKHKPKRRHRGH